MPAESKRPWQLPGPQETGVLPNLYRLRAVLLAREVGRLLEARPRAADRLDERRAVEPLPDDRRAVVRRAVPVRAVLRLAVLRLAVLRRAVPLRAVVRRLPERAVLRRAVVRREPVLLRAVDRRVVRPADAPSWTAFSSWLPSA